MNFLRGLSTVAMLTLEFTRGSSNPVHLLAGNKTDYCYAEPYITKRAECLQLLLSLYYGQLFPVDCPNFASLIAAEECKGCPWSRINATAITPAYARALGRSKLFQSAEPSCSLSEYTFRIDSSMNGVHLSFFGLVVPLFSVMFLSMCDKNGSHTTPLLFGARMVEPCYFVVLWILFFVGYGIFVAGSEIDSFCEGPLSYSMLLIGGWVNLGMMLWTSWWRCYCLEAHDTHKEVASWVAYRRSTLYRKSAIWQQRMVDLICWSGPTLILLSILSNEVYAIKLVSTCKMGSYKSIGYGIIQYSKLVLALLAIGVYSLGPPRRLTLFYVRYSLLIVVLLLSISLLVVMGLPVYQPQCLSTLIPHVRDCEVAGPLHAELVAHSFATALLGLTEPIRLGWPRRPKQKLFMKDTMCPDLTQEFY